MRASRTDILAARLADRCRGVEPKFIPIDDSREQLSYAPLWPGVTTITACLPTGDYSFCGARGRFAVERKSAADFVQSVTAERTRFFAEVERLAAMDGACIVIESHPGRLATDIRYGAGNVNAWIASALAIVADHRVPIWWAADRERGAKATLWMLRRWHERVIAENAREAA